MQQIDTERVQEEAQLGEEKWLKFDNTDNR